MPLWLATTVLIFCRIIVLIVCGGPYGELLGSGAALQKLKGLQRPLAEKYGLAKNFFPLIALPGLMHETARHWQVKKAVSHSK